MSDTVFKEVRYSLSSLVEYIELGDIGLPDIQRPFVWKNVKVRDLFDSMYRGYPVGYFLFWQNAFSDSHGIGIDTKQKPPRLLIVDGQQRLTSIYAVIKGVPIIRNNFDKESIKIAFNPLDEKFEVADATTLRDKAYIPDISVLWNATTDLFEVVDKYLEGVQNSRELTQEETRKARKSISKLHGLTTFPFTALELAPTIDEEEVAEVFVRINSKGKALNQADFILTLMSVFWDSGRSELEEFCRLARTPSEQGPSPYNHFIQPEPDQLLRVSVGIGFKRARLQYVYSILRGKDLETSQFSEERRIAQFEVLKHAQERVLNLQYWHDFMIAIRMAGYRAAKMISSKNNLLFSYILYLIGRTEYKVEERRLRKMVARWFFMSSLTGRFTGSPESAMEFEFARLRDIEDGDTFVEVFEQISDMTLSEDFWTFTLPNDLATSSPLSPSLFAYQAALVLLEAPALFSKQKISDLLDPTIHANRAAVERHHLFPKAHLKTLGISTPRETNQIANYALMEWGDNMVISDNSPVDYVPIMSSHSNSTELASMWDLHALPEGWQDMEYRQFLQRRRELMAGVIRRAYEMLTGKKAKEGTKISVADFVAQGEGSEIEFKSTLRVNLHTGKRDERMEHAILKTIAGFLNGSGGSLVIGVADNGDPVGLDIDGFPNEDKMGLHLVNLVRSRLGTNALTDIHPRFQDYEDSRSLIVECKRSVSPVFLKNGNQEQFYIRTGPSTTELTPSQTQEYIKKRFR